MLELSPRSIARLARGTHPRRRLFLAAVVMLFVAGGVVMTSIALVPDNPIEPVISLVPDAPPPETISMRAVIRSIDPSRGELGVRLTIEQLADYGNGGIPNETLRVDVPDTAGRSPVIFLEDEPLRSIDITLALGGSQVTSYPFDRYEALVGLALHLGDDLSGRSIPVRIDIADALEGFSVRPAGDSIDQASVIAQPVRIERSRGVVAWSVTFLVLIWLIGISVVSIAWWTVAWAVEIPLWSWAVMVSVLFALPTMRAQMPGSPPYGSLIDWAGFYWIISLVTLCFVANVVLWNIEARRTLVAAKAAHGLRSGDDPTATETEHEP